MANKNTTNYQFSFDQHLFINSEPIVITSNHYPKGWKAVQFTIDDKPKGFWQWWHFLWGWDVWYGKFPLFKSLVIINILIWILYSVR